jgi:hypothetical protein
MNVISKTLRLYGGVLQRKLRSGIWRDIPIKPDPTTGYCRVNLNGKLYGAHRLVYALYHEADPKGMDIDHINGNRADNQIDNLRLVSPRYNAENRIGRRDGSGLPVGVYKDHGRFSASIRIGINPVFLGRWETLEDAGKSYEMARAFVSVCHALMEAIPSKKAK